MAEHGTVTEQYPAVNQFNRKYNRAGYKAHAKMRMPLCKPPESMLRNHCVAVTWGKDYREPTLGSESRFDIDSTDAHTINRAMYCVLVGTALKIAQARKGE